MFLAQGWEIIPVENILACTCGLGLECESLDRARLAAGVLERGADRLLITPEAMCDVKTIVNELKLSQGTVELVPATITAIEHAGLGHRVCVDTTSILKTGEGMLVGYSSAFSFWSTPRPSPTRTWRPGPSHQCRRGPRLLPDAR